ncbi:hypothetical protein PSTG_12167 [Puccinia striiformis f. sp. tritici PST-78]|uniref:Uncharacterized protein n=1 Tax=Puccinia striiformis f. sp. tritici PST-78 TaxID=1165861 RepID=A0A0L0V5R7_9BASI|nr:hypothetical protein PSTG_12167 [Puccinia striiformis f. sp. tritici PST-78]
MHVKITLTRGTASLVPYFATCITTFISPMKPFLPIEDCVCCSLPFFFPHALELILSDGFLPAANFDVDTALALLYHNEDLKVTYGAGPSTGASTLLFEVCEPIKLVNLSAERYWLGALLVALAWPTLLLPHQVALASQWAALTIVWYTDMLAKTLLSKKKLQSIRENQIAQHNNKAFLRITDVAGARRKQLNEAEN